VFFNLDGCRPDEEGSIGFIVRAESFICGILRVMGDLEFTLPVFGTELGSVRHRSTCHRVLLKNVMTPYAWLRKFFGRVCDCAKPIDVDRVELLEWSQRVRATERRIATWIEQLWSR